MYSISISISHTPHPQAELISEVLDAVAPGTPVALLLLSGGCVDVSAFQADPRVGAILWAGYPGQAGGDAVADALYGEFSPAGRTTQTWYPAEFVDQARGGGGAWGRRIGHCCSPLLHHVPAQSDEPPGCGSVRCRSHQAVTVRAESRLRATTHCKT